MYVINRNSWHYRFLKWWGVNMYKINNFCDYWRALFIRLTIAGLLLAFFSYLIVGFIVGLYYILFTDVNIPGIFEAGFAVTLMGVIFFAVAVCVWGVMHAIKSLPKRTKTESDKQPSLLVMKYKSVKEKICPMVEFK